MRKKTHRSRAGIKLKHSGFEGVTLLGMVLLFVVIMTPMMLLAIHNNITGNVVDVEPTYDEITAMAVSSSMDPAITITIITVLTVIFLIPVELMLRKRDKTARNKKL